MFPFRSTHFPWLSIRPATLLCSTFGRVFLRQSDARFYLLDTPRTFPPTAPRVHVRLVFIPVVG